jgi:Flp pilus assembly protein TadB
MPKATLPWLLPLALLIAVLVVALTNSLVVGILFLLVGWVGVPLAYLAYARTRREEREHGRSG